MLWPSDVQLIRSVCMRCAMLAVLSRAAWRSHLLACIPVSEN